MNVWPATLPQHFEQQGYNYAKGDNRLMTEQESGAVKGRRRFSYIPEPFQGAMKMTRAQRDKLEAFWATTGGVLPFTMPQPGGGEDWVVQFGRTPPSWRILPGDRWLVQLDMVRLPQ